MNTILYTDREGGDWEPMYLDDWSEETVKRLCKAQKLPYVDSDNKVEVAGIKTAAILFHDGTIWDAILSGYVSVSWKRRLPKCFPDRFRHEDWRYANETNTRSDI